MDVDSFVEQMGKRIRELSDGRNIHLKGMQVSGCNWKFFYWTEEDQIALKVNKNGTSYFYNDMNTDKEDIDQGCLTIRDYLANEIRECTLHPYQLEKIIFELI